MSGPLDSRLLLLAPEDNVAAARQSIAAGETILVDGSPCTVQRAVPVGHKVAIRAVAVGEPVLKYGAPIGLATVAMRPGDYVHTHNLTSNYLPTYTLDGENRFRQ